MYKVAVIGDKDSIYGFELLGLDVFPTDNVEDKEKLMNKLCNGNYGIIYVTEALAEELSELIEKYDDINIKSMGFPENWKTLLTN